MTDTANIKWQLKLTRADEPVQRGCLARRWEGSLQIKPRINPDDKDQNVFSSDPRYSALIRGLFSGLVDELSHR
jgi:hypothetical protein